MTSPDSFDYTDDSVIARVSVDVPTQAIADISQLSSAMGAMRTQLEAIARAQGDWLDYLQQIPVIAERANQAYRDQITQLERISYIQNELGNSGGMGGGGDANVSPTTQLRTSGSPGAGGYSTAAPAGYVNPFQGMVSGVGGGGTNKGATSIADIAGQLQALSGDGRMMSNMASARGMAVNPALLGVIGGAAGVVFGQDTGGGQGKGEEDPGSQSPQPTQAGRTAAGKPASHQSGQPVGSEPQREPAPAGMDGSAWQVFRDNVMGEVKSGFGGSRIGQILGTMAPAAVGSLFGGGGGGPGGGGGGGGGIPGGLGGGGALGKIMGNKWLKGGAIAGAGLAAFNMAQDVGERMTRFQMLGSEEGGDWSTGLKEDVHARMIALDPRINADQARKAIQMPMSAGFQGSSRDELRDLLINNFRELGVSMADSMTIEMANLRGKEISDENVKKSRTSNEATLNVMKELAGDGGNTMALSERIEELKKLSVVLNSLGSGQESIERAAIGWQEGYKDSTALRGAGSKVISQTMASGTLMSIVGQRVGVTGIVPEAMPAALEEAGFDPDEITNMAATEAAKYVQGIPNKLNRIGMFMSLMRENGVDLDWPQAKDLYERVTGTGGKENPTAKANKAIAAKGQKNQNNLNPFGVVGDLMYAKTPSDFADAFAGRRKPSQNADNVYDSFEQAGRIPESNLYAPTGQTPRQPPQNMAQIPQRQSVSTQGTVTGEVRIVVDQQGRVSAPQVIQLSGQQKAALAGYGAAQLNNAPPGDPTYYHAYNPLPGGVG